MNNKTINIVLTLAQSDALLRALKPIADSIEARAVIEARPMNNEEDLLVSALSWMYIEITGELNNVKEVDILEQRANYNKYYRKELQRQARDN